MRFWPSALRLVAAYLIGMIGMGLLISFLGGNLGIAQLFAVGGTIVALPLLIVAVATLAIFRTCIEDHLERWCVVAPIAVGIAWFVLVRIASSERATELFATEHLAAEMTLAGLGVVSAAIASLAFYLMQYDRT